MTDGPQIQIDDDWKAQAQAEREKLAERERQKKAEQEAQAKRDAMKPDPAASPAGMPGDDSGAPYELADDEPADFNQLITTLASQALMYMGLVPDPQTGQRMVGFEYARRQIDMMEVLEEKTKGNLSTEESNSLASMLHQLREQYVQTVVAMRPIPSER